MRSKPLRCVSPSRRVVTTHIHLSWEWRCRGVGGGGLELFFLKTTPCKVDFHSRQSLWCARITSLTTGAFRDQLILTPWVSVGFREKTKKENRPLRPKASPPPCPILPGTTTETATVRPGCLLSERAARKYGTAETSSPSFRSGADPSQVWF